MARRTSRLLLRRWTDADRVPFAAMNADARVMRYFPAPLDRAQSDAFADSIDEHFDEHGFGLWAVELVDELPFVGFVGLGVPAGVSVEPTVPGARLLEIGWRLDAAVWRRGIASEAAQSVLEQAATELGNVEVATWTAAANVPSVGVMEKLGLHRDAAADFDHPRVPEGSWLRRHVVYRANS